ncbi:MAG: Xaa-Pro peptidase family protein [Candidatus Omnitrophota bacterium]|jgi:Xaa-Pro aminopeptidase
MNITPLLIKELKSNGLDGFIVSSSPNTAYLTQFPNPDAYLLAASNGLTYFTDSRYTQEAKKKLKGIATIKHVNGSVFKLIAQSCTGLGLKRIGFEERHLPYAEYKKIKEHLKAGAFLVPAHGIIEELRMIKRAEEIAKIRKALEITALAIEFIKDFIRPGVRELEIAAELERFIRYQGAIGSAFDIIVASGANSCHPHHLPTSRRLGDKDIVLVDVGVDYLGYKSDLTRVFFLGKINGLARRIYELVLKAQEIAIKKAKPGERAGVIDAASRKYIAARGYGDYFVHSLGHGVGINIHEDPSISSKSEDILKEGMVFTVEPAVYLPGKFGIRIEDMVLVTKRGCEVLSGFINK